MKKIVVLLLVLAVVAGQALFAQEEGLKVSGAVKTGFNISGGSTDNGTDTVNKPADFAMASDDAGVPLRADLTFGYTNGGAGATATFRYDYAATDAISLAAAYGWFGILDDMVQFSAGLLDNGKWGTVDGFNLDTNIDNKNFFKVEVKPIEGLSLGINTLDITNGKRRIFGGYEDSHNGPWQHDYPDNPLQSTVYGAKYENADAGLAVSAEFVGYNDWDVWVSNLPSFGWVKTFGLSTLTHAGFYKFGALASAKYSGVENLKVVLDFYVAADDESDSKWTSSTLGIAVGGYYTLDKLSAGAKVVFGSAEAAVDGNGLGTWDLQIVPKASYGINDIVTVGIEVPLKFIENLTVKGKGVSTTIDGYPVTINDDIVKDWKGGFAIGVKPSATFNFGNGATFVAFYNLTATNHGFYDKDGGKQTKDVGHALQFDFIWSF